MQPIAFSIVFHDFTCRVTFLTGIKLLCKNRLPKKCVTHNALLSLRNGGLSSQCCNWLPLNPYMYSCHEKLQCSVFFFLLSIFSCELCVCSQLMLNLVAFIARMSFAVTLGDLVSEQLDHLVAVNLSAGCGRSS